MRARDRERRFRLIREIGCIACIRYGLYSRPEVHHLNLGGHAGQRRRGDEFTIGLCRWHHQGQMHPIADIGPSLKLEPREFRHLFGTDDELLARQNRLIAQREALRV